MNKERRTLIDSLIVDIGHLTNTIEALSGASDTMGFVENAKDAEQEYFDNMPESMQNGDKEFDRARRDQLARRSLRPDGSGGAGHRRSRDRARRLPSIWKRPRDENADAAHRRPNLEGPQAGILLGPRWLCIVIGTMIGAALSNFR